MSTNIVSLFKLTQINTLLSILLKWLIPILEERGYAVCGGDELWNKLFFSSPAMWPFIFQRFLKNGRTTIMFPESLEMNLCAWLEKHLGHSKSLVIKDGQNKYHMVKAGQGSPVFLDWLNSPKLRVKAWTPARYLLTSKAFCFHCRLYVWLTFLIKNTLPQSMDNLVVFCVWSRSVIANSLAKSLASHTWVLGVSLSISLFL